MPTGGVMQLVAVGAQDQYLTGQPAFSYFKTAIKTHTNFSMESVRQTFATKPTLDQNSSSYTCQLQRVGDLLGEVFLNFELPNIYSSDTFRFQWIPNLAKHMILGYSISIANQMIDQRYGDWLDIWTELTLSTDKLTTMNNMMGNIPEFTAPTSKKEKIIIINNRIYYSYYPSSSGPQDPAGPSIAGRRFVIPLDFWFCRSPALAIPLVALQSQIPSITIEFRGIEDLYQVYDVVTDEYVSPSELRARYQARGLPVPPITIGDFTKAAPVVDLNAYLECNFYYLDEAERRMIAARATDYIVDRVYRVEQSGITLQNTVDLTLSNPVKEIIWFLRRTDAFKKNAWYDFTNGGAEIMNTAKFIWNGVDRFDEKPSTYFHLIQPYQYHTRGPRDGIYAYSFGIYPEKAQPSGTFNASKINKIQIALTTTGGEYTLILYSVYYNIFRVSAGVGGMVFTA